MRHFVVEDWRKTSSYNERPVFKLESNVKFRYVIFGVELLVWTHAHETSVWRGPSVFLDQWRKVGQRPHHHHALIFVYCIWCWAFHYGKMALRSRVCSRSSMFLTNLYWSKGNNIEAILFVWRTSECNHDHCFVDQEVRYVGLTLLITHSLWLSL